MASHVEERGRLWNSGVRVVHYETCDVDREWWIVDAYDYTSTVQHRRNKRYMLVKRASGCTSFIATKCS